MAAETVGPPERETCKMAYMGLTLSVSALAQEDCNPVTVRA